MGRKRVREGIGRVVPKGPDLSLDVSFVTVSIPA
jgi:hypothetical protein